MPDPLARLACIPLLVTPVWLHIFGLVWCHVYGRPHCILKIFRYLVRLPCHQCSRWSEPEIWSVNNGVQQDMPQPTLAAGRGELAQQVVEALKDDEEPMVTGMNLRDMATTSPETMRNGLAFRSSQVFRHATLAPDWDLAHHMSGCHAGFSENAEYGALFGPSTRPFDPFGWTPFDLRPVGCRALFQGYLSLLWGHTL